MTECGWLTWSSAERRPDVDHASVREPEGSRDVLQIGLGHGDPSGNRAEFTLSGHPLLIPTVERLGLEQRAQDRLNDGVDPAELDDDGGQRMAPAQFHQLRLGNADRFVPLLQRVQVVDVNILDVEFQVLGDDGGRLPAAGQREAASG